MSDAIFSALERALQMQPEDVDLRLHLADLYLSDGQHESALAHARVVLATRPDSAEALRCAASAAEALGDPIGQSYHRLAQALDGSPLASQPSSVDSHTVPESADDLLELWDRVEPPTVGSSNGEVVRFSDVGGLQNVKERLELTFLQPMRHPDIAASFGATGRGGLLLWGPPGCGKTYIARACAGELGAQFYSVGLAEVLDMWVGSSERNVASVFDYARRNRPCLLFFDEIDALGMKRSQLGGTAMRGVVNQLLSELDGAGQANDGVFVLAATNHPWDVDPALLRPGRFDRTLLVLPPDRDARSGILASHLRGRPQERLDLTSVAKSTDGFSGADLALICQVAVESAMAASLKSGTVTPITNRDLHQAARSVKPSIGPWLETARNHALYSNETGQYDELVDYLRKHR